MSKAVRIHALGGPEVLRFEDVAVPPPAAGEIQMRHTAIGINFIDVYYRTGIYTTTLPATIGSEGVGVVLAVGAGVTEFAPGDRVCYASYIGSDCEVRNLPAERAVMVPDDIGDEQTAAMMLKGMTARSLLRRSYVVKPGDTVLVQAAAGGVGLILCQWAKALGATVIGTVGSKEKATLARAHGADHTILYRETDFVQAVREITRGEGANVVYDAVGVDTFVKSIQCVAPFGTVVSFGQASGKVPPIDVLLLREKSAYVTRTSLAIHITKRADLLASAADVFDVVKRGVVKVDIRRRYALADAIQAHRDLESRVTEGSSIYLP